MGMALFLLHGGEHVVAHVRPSVVVEVYNVCNDTRCLTEVGGACGRHSLCDVLVLEVVVVGVGRMPTACWFQDKVVFVQELVELVATDHRVRTDVPEHIKHFLDIYAGGFGADVPHGLDEWSAS